MIQKRLGIRKPSDTVALGDQSFGDKPNVLTANYATRSTPTASGGAEPKYRL